MFKSVPPEEINRKFLHVLVIAFPLGVFYGPQLFSTSRFNIFVLTFLICLLSLFIDLLRIRNDTFGNWFSSKFGRLLRAHENAHLTGATYIFGGISFCACLSIVSEVFAVCACLASILFILGDAAAAIGGKALGRIRIGKKTMEGSISCFVLCLILAYWFSPFLPGFSDKWGGAILLWQAIVIAGSVSLLELFPIRIGKIQLNDNLYVPVIVSYFCTLVR
jgi:dolichol kinase